MSNPPPYAPDETKGLYPTAEAYPPQPQPQPGVVTYYPPGPQQQQPQQLVIAQPAPVIIQQEQSRPSFVCHIVFSCCTFCCCFWPFGLVAFILAGENCVTSSLH